jgi:hypothetical protein
LTAGKSTPRLRTRPKDHLPGREEVPLTESSEITQLRDSLETLRDAQQSASNRGDHRRSEGLEELIRRYEDALERRLREQGGT